MILSSLELLSEKPTALDVGSSLDWFFTAGGGIDEDNGFIDYAEIDTYNEFILALAANKDIKVKNVLQQILH